MTPVQIPLYALPADVLFYVQLIFGFGVLGGAVLLYLAVRRLAPRQYPWAIGLVPMIFCGLHFAIAMPLYSTLNSTADPLLLAAGFWLSSALGIGVSLALGRLLCRDAVTTSTQHETVATQQSTF